MLRLSLSFPRFFSFVSPFLRSFRSLNASQKSMPLLAMMASTETSTRGERRPIERIGVIGGGITGALIASELDKHASFREIIVFDQGQRGPGGRASHRSVDPLTHQVLADDDRERIASGKCYEFDHGCQFFRADSSEMQTMVETWIQKGWVESWSSARWGRLGSSPDFFGLPGTGTAMEGTSITSTDQQPVFVAVGGMHQLPRKLLQDSSSRVRVHTGTRISRVTSAENGKWHLWGLQGKAAFHDTPEAQTRDTSPQILDTVDAVIVTDASASQETWHRASAGLPQQFVRQSLEHLIRRPRVPFFSCMVALKQPLRPHLKLDALIGDAPLWCAVCSNSKPGFPKDQDVECWTLVSTPDFSVEQIQETSMRNRTTGAFRPQESQYLNSIPGPLLLEAFKKAVKPYLPKDVCVEAVYIQAQRWGSGLPNPQNATRTINVDGLEYVSHIDTLVYSRPKTDASDFVADDERCLYYAGDFCSHRNPGFEAAALSGRDLVRHIIQLR